LENNNVTEAEHGKDVWNDVKDYMRDMRERGYDAEAIRSDTKDSEGRKVKAYVVRTSEAPTPPSPTASEAMEGAKEAAVRGAARARGREIGEIEGEEEYPPVREFGKRRLAEREREEEALREERLTGELISGADPITKAVYKKVAGVDEYGRKVTKKKKVATRGRVLYDSSGKAIVVEGLKSKKPGWRKGLKDTGKLGQRKDTKALKGYKSLGKKFGSPRTKMSVMPGTPRIAQTGGGMPKIAELGMSRRPRIASDPDLSSMRGMSWPPQEREEREGGLS